MKRQSASLGAKPRQYNALKRGTTPRLRAFIEERLRAYPTRKDAADSLEISPTEVSFFAQGSRTPSAEQILKFLSLVPNGAETLDSREFCGNLDQRLIDGGYAPLFFKHLVPMDKSVLVIKRNKKGYAIDRREEFPSILSDLRFLCRRAGLQIALIDGDRGQPFYLLLEPVYDDTELLDGEVTLFAKGEHVNFGRISRDGDEVRLALVEPPSMEDRDTQETPDGIDLRARVLLQFNSPAKATSRSTPSRNIRGLDRLSVGVSPFQDSLLVSIGVELGFFEEEGLLVELEPVEWYDWHRYFDDESGARIVFGNIYSFIQMYKELPSLRFLYGVNLFDHGFALLSKSGGRTLEDVFAERNPAKIRIGTIAESDWAAQLFTLCEERRYNLIVDYGPFDDHIYPSEGQLSSNPTIVIVDKSRRTGVVNDPRVINETEDFYLGSMPQRFRLTQDFGWKTLDEPIAPPFPVNGFIGGSELFPQNKDILLRFLRVWFRIANYIRHELGPKNLEASTGALAGSRLVQRALDSGLFAAHTAKLKIGSTPGGQIVNEIADAWRHECFPKTPAEIEKFILGSAQASPWKADAKRAIQYLLALFRRKISNEQEFGRRWQSLQQQLNGQAEASADCPFLLQQVHEEYVAQYGRGTIVRTDLDGAPRPSSLNLISDR